MGQQIGVDPDARADDPRKEQDDGTHEIADDLAYRRLGIVNVIFFGRAGAKDREWVLIDAGVMGTTGLITNAATERFGPDSRPAAIIMTHGHFDHVGALEELAERWETPVYAHELERPYLDGSASYPPPDPSVGGGLMSLLSPLYPRGPVNVSRWLRTFPQDGSVPEMPGWRWLHTPGHTPGHISLWRESDRTIIAGDAFITTRQESAYAVTVQQPELHGPPMYYTTNWENALRSVERLASLEPNLVITGHGPAMRGAEMKRALHELSRNFNRVAVPEDGKYVHSPARVEDNSEYREP
ncbi:MBL fold metallo-hydrolase [Chelativorans sp. Marseille-P2723]|uniref:MBL fold metallo-hydrolase n=1 Tax=Chelativorans sp. Marseille-P2723 TaxID=2709133 RepID=UPI0015706969|nr:MBL fold metallo-hydrolase [Chelativorans sp. Marseille-P2723]